MKQRLAENKSGIEAQDETHRIELRKLKSHFLEKRRVILIFYFEGNGGDLEEEAQRNDGELRKA